MTGTTTGSDKYLDRVYARGYNSSQIRFVPSSYVSGGHQTEDPWDVSFVVTALQPGSHTVSFEPYVGDSDEDDGGVNLDQPSPCDRQFTFTTAAPPGAWWQAVNASVISQASITSRIPQSCSGSCSPYLILSTTGNSPGVAVYGPSPATRDFSSTDTQGSASAIPPYGWLAQSTTTTAYNYQEIRGSLPTSITTNTVNASTNLNNGTTASDGYKYYVHTGDLTLNNVQSISSRVVLLVSGNLTINNRISITNPGQGFFMAAAGGNITVGSTVGGNPAPNLQGLFLTNQQFNTNTGNNPLRIKGSVVALGSVNLGRNLANNATTPAEVFEHDPTLLLLYPNTLSKNQIIWQEVAP